MTAFVQSWNAMLAEMLTANVRLAFGVMPWFWLRSPFGARSSHVAYRQVQRAGLAVLAKGIAPVHRRALANARRLGRAGRTR